MGTAKSRKEEALPPVTQKKDIACIPGTFAESTLHSGETENV